MYTIYKKSHDLNEIIFLDFYISEDSSDLENLSLRNMKWTFSLFFFSLDDLLQLHFFLLGTSIFTTVDKEKEGKVNEKYFWRILLKFEEKILEIHKQCWLSITCILKKLNSIQTLVEDIPEIPDLTGPFCAKPVEIHIQ